MNTSLKALSILPAAALAACLAASPDNPLVASSMVYERPPASSVEGRSVDDGVAQSDQFEITEFDSLPVALPVESSFTSPLGMKVAAALRGEAKPTHEAKPRRGKWICSGWKELWQGSGRARDCNWR